jgi:hypothetical protein
LPFDRRRRFFVIPRSVAFAQLALPVFPSNFDNQTLKRNFALSYANSTPKTVHHY